MHAICFTSILYLCLRTKWIFEDKAYSRGTNTRVLFTTPHCVFTTCSPVFQNELKIKTENELCSRR